MDFSITIDDSNVDTLARRLGWTEFVGLERKTPNPIDQSTWIADKARAYLDTEVEAAFVAEAADAARAQAISDAQQQTSLNLSTVTKASGILTTGGGIKSVPPITPPLQ